MKLKFENIEGGEIIIKMDEIENVIYFSEKSCMVILRDNAIEVKGHLFEIKKYIEKLKIIRKYQNHVTSNKKEKAIKRQNIKESYGYNYNTDYKLNHTVSCIKIL